MTTQVSVKKVTPPRSGKHFESAVAKNAVQQYVCELVPEVLVFFAIQNVSLRPLQYFCTQVLNYPINIPAIEQVICHAGAKARQRLGPLDLKAGERVSRVEMDTTWKGRWHKFFAAIAREGNYLFCLEPVHAESDAVVRPHLRRLAEVCCNLRLVVTDMALGFEKAIPRAFRGVVHLFCHNHMLKAVDREMPELRQDFLATKKARAKSKAPATTVDKWLRRNRARLYNARNYRKKLQRQKVELCRQHGIPVKESGAMKDPGKGLPPFLRALSLRISRAQVREARYKRQVARQLAKRAKVRKGVQKAAKVYARAWNQYAAARQIRARFRALLRTTSLREFRRLRQVLERRVANMPNRMTHKISEYLTLPQLTHLFHFSPAERATLGPINTNRVEGFFAQMRVLLDGLRNAPDTPYVRARLALFRYWHNVVGPLSGANAGVPPYRQLGIALLPGNPIRAICAGAPMPRNVPDSASWMPCVAGVRA